MYSINATFVTSYNTSKVRYAKRISTTRIYFAFFRGRHDRLNEFVILIYAVPDLDKERP